MRLNEMRARDVRTVHMFRFLPLLSIISSAFPCQYLFLYRTHVGKRVHDRFSWMFDVAFEK